MLNGPPYHSPPCRWPLDNLCVHTISQVNVTDDMLSVDLEDGRTIAVPIGWFPRWRATPGQDQPSLP